MVLALPRSTLLWPANLEERLDAAAMRTVLLHELAHLKRRDHLTAWLEVIVACLWWWHPIVWWARRDLRQYAELACDAWVVAALPGERSRYAKALVDVCEFISLAKPAAAPAVGMARGNRRCFERRLHMILRQPIAGRMSLLAWTVVVAFSIFVMPGFSTGQDSAGVADDSQPARPSKTRILSAATDQPTEAAAIDPAAGESPAHSTTNDVSEDVPAQSKTNASADPPVDQHFIKLHSDVLDLLHRVRGQGRSLTSEEKWRVIPVMRGLAKRTRDTRQRDDVIVNEVYAYILARRPSEFELSRGLSSLRSKDFDVYDIVNQLLSSNEFIDGPPQKRTTAPTSLPGEPYRTKQAKTQTLLRVIYDMPRDKGEALANFLKDHVAAGHIDVKTVESGLVVTAEANIQRTIASVVSLMIGEPISLDLGDVPPIGHPMNPPLYYQQPDSPYGSPTNVPAATTAQSGPPRVYPPAGPQLGKMMVPRTLVDPVTGNPRTVYETRPYSDGELNAFDPTSPRPNPASVEEKRNPTTTPQDSPPRP
jgi:hypothetical protein